MKIAACSIHTTPLDFTGNAARIRQGMDEARKADAGLVLFPELALSGYGCEDYFLMPWLYEQAFEVLCSEILPHTKELAVALGMPFFWEGKRYNGLAICHNGKLEGIYLKQILAGEGVFYEPRWFSAWKPKQQVEVEKNGQRFMLGDFTWDWEGLSVGFEICEDAWHPEKRPAVVAAAHGADLILNASASNYERGKRPARHDILRQLKGKSLAAYLYTNLCGNESGKLIFDGEIFFGKAGCLMEAGPILFFAESKLAVFELDDSGHEIPTPEEDVMEEFTRAAGLGLIDYLRKSGSKGFALSLSGGADSAACAVLVAEMLKMGYSELGKEGLEKKLGFALAGISPTDWTRQILHCVYQGTRNSGPVTRNAARKVAEEIGARFTEWEVDELVEAYTKRTEAGLGRKLDWAGDDLVLQNIQARSRGPGVWMLANAQNFLLITTSNRSEGDVGYCTMDGDTAGSIAPIAGVSKHFIRQWLIWARDTRGYKSLQFIIEQAPTAELRPQGSGQTDEKDLMPYELLEEIERAFLEMRMAPEQIPAYLNTFRAETLPELEAHCRKFFQLWKRSQWKRERLAPSFHLDRFNIDPKSEGRFPIFSA